VAGERAHLAFIFPDGDLWHADAILGNLRRQMNERHERAEHLAGDAKLAHTDHLRKLVETLRDYAKDVRAVYGDRLADRMLHVADDLTVTMEFPRHCIENPPRDARGRANLFVTIALWTFDQVRAAIPARQIPGYERGR
jgi:hypothetical protein